MDDIDAILNETDSEEEDLDVEDINLEDILREQSDDEGEEGKRREKFPSSLLSTVGYEHSEFLETAELLTSLQDSNVRPTEDGVMEAGDAQMLNKLLGEDEAHTTETGSPPLMIRSSSAIDIDRIIDSVDNDAEVSAERLEGDDEAEFREMTGLSTMKLDALLRGISSEAAADDQKIDGAYGAEGEFPTPSGAAALEMAAARERALLTAGNRDTVSPLQVKRAGRRNRPGAGLVKVEVLESISRQLRKNAQYSAARRQEQFLEAHPHRQSSPSGPVGSAGAPGKTALAPPLGPGLPSALATHARYVAIGTTVGIVLVFDHCQEIKQIIKVSESIGSSLSSAASSISAKVLKQNSKSSGSALEEAAGESHKVSALDISPSGEFLVCGYESGRIVLWDIAKGSVLKNVTDAHKAKIIFAQFYHRADPSLITVDETGAVNKLIFSKLFWATYVADIECLLDGTAGPIPAVGIIPYWYSPPCTKSESKTEGMEEPFATIMLIGLCSKQSTFIIEVHPEVRVLYKWAKPPEDTCLENPPCLAWTWPKNSTASCILARGWGCTLELLQVTLPQEPKPGEPASNVSSFRLQHTIPVASPVLAVGWLGAETLVYLCENGDSTESKTQSETQTLPGFCLNVYDITKQSCLESLSLNHHGTAQHWEFNKGRVGSLQNSFRTCRARLYLLGDEELRSATVQSWEQRIDYLLESGEWMEALAVAVDHFERAAKATNHKYTEGQASVKYMADLLLRYLRLAVDNAPNASPGASDSSAMLVKSHYQMLAGVCLEYCAITNRLDLLYGPIFQKFAMVGQLRTLLDTLEPYVLSDRLNYIAPEPMAIFIEHCQQRNDLPAVERVLLHLDVKILDFDHIIKLLKAHKLYSSVIHVYSKGLQDFVTPLEVLMGQIIELIWTGGPSLHLLLYKTILYLRHVFEGKGFPDGDPIDENLRLGARAQLLYFLLTSHIEGDTSELDEIKSTKYPYLRALLSMDVKETLQTIADGLDCKERMFIASDEAESDHFAEVFKVCRANKSEVGFIKCPHPQFVATALCSVLIAKDAGRAPTFSKGPWASISKDKDPWPQGVDVLLYGFFAKYMETGKLRLSDGITGAVLFYLVGQGHSTEAQLCGIVKHLGSRVSTSDRLLKTTSVMLKRCEDAIPTLNRAAAMLHQLKTTHAKTSETARVHFKKALTWILADSDEQHQKTVFPYIDNEIRFSQHTSSKMKLQDISTVVLSKIHKLVQIDQCYTVRIIQDMFGEDHSQVLVELQAIPSAQYAYMSAAATAEKPDGSPAVLFKPEDTNQYIRLMCEFQPEAVYKYLRTHDDYNLDECLRWCEEYKVTDAQAYLLEKRGDVAGALDLVLGSLLGSLQAIKGAVAASKPHAAKTKLRLFSSRHDARHVDGRSILESTPEGLKAKALLLVAVDLCQRATPPLRNSAGLGPTVKAVQSRKSGMTEGTPGEGGHASGAVQLWFRMLDRLFDAKGALAQQESQYQGVVLQGVVNWTIQRVLDGMSDRVPLQLIVKKITDDYASQKLGDFKDVFLNMVETYTFETNIFSTAAAIIYEDLGIRIREKYSIKVSGIHVTAVEAMPLPRGGGRMRRYCSSSVPSQGVLRVLANGVAKIDRYRTPSNPELEENEEFLPGYERWRATMENTTVKDNNTPDDSPSQWEHRNTRSKVMRLRKSRRRMQKKAIMNQGTSIRNLLEEQLRHQAEDPNNEPSKAPGNVPKVPITRRIPGKLPYEPQCFRKMDQNSIIS